MWRPGIKLASSLLVAVGAGTLGYVAFAQQGAGGPPAGAARGPGLEGAARKYLADRVETARKIIEHDWQRLQYNVGTDAYSAFEQIPDWSHRLMVDRLRLARNAGDCVDAIREHRKRMIEFEAVMTAYAKAGQGRMANALKGKYYRLEADQLLAEEGIDPEKEPIDPALRKAEKAPAPPPAAPVPSRR